MATDILDVQALDKRFGGLKALRSCSFSVPLGSITAVVGPNGSGKTTLFNCVTGLLRADGGEILFEGQSMLRLSSDAIARAGLARTFQTTRVFQKLTVEENLVAAASHSQRGAAKSGLELIDMFGLGQFISRRAGDLSYGQQKLVEMAAVMAMRPTLVLLDEPAAGVSPQLIEMLGSYIRDLNARGTTFVVVEHNMPFVFDLCDPVIVLDQGAVIAAAAPAEVRANDRVLDAYLGTGAPDA